MSNLLSDFFYFFSCFYKFASYPRKVSFYILIFLMVISSFAEILSISSVMPFLILLTNQELIMNHIYFKKIFDLLGLSSFDKILYFLSFIFIVLAILSTYLKLLTTWLSAKISNIFAAELSKIALKKILHQNYEFFFNTNSNEYISTLTRKMDMTNIAVQSLFNIISSLLILIVILITFLIFFPYLALPIIISSFVLYIIVIQVLKKQLKKNSSIINENQNKLVQILSESLEGVREVIINKLQKYFYDRYYKRDYNFRKAQAKNYFIQTLPRYLFELIIMLALVIVAIIISINGLTIKSFLPIFGVIILGAQRTLPLLQQCYWGFSYMIGTHNSIKDTVEVLNLEDNKLSSKNKVTFDSTIDLVDLSFSYTQLEKKVINQLNLTIHKNKMHALIGQSGVGKTTLIEIIMGLLRPTGGKLLIDGKELNVYNLSDWHNKIAYVPQKIFLSDKTFAENIAYGNKIEDIDYKKLKEVSILAEIDTFISSKTDGYKSLVGERGIKLSGGQLQRIGIARALYKKADLIILDEITSSLDEETEKKIIKLVKNLAKTKTIIFVTHKKNIAEMCDIVFDLNELN